MDNFFKCDAMEEFGKLMDCEIEFSPVYRPQANMVERVHRDLRILIPDLRETYKDKIDALDWSKILPIAANIINTTPHSTTGFSPYLLHHGFLSNDVFEEQTVTGMEENWKIARERMVKRQKDNLKQTESPIKTICFDAGEKVWVHLPNQETFLASVVFDHGDTLTIDKGMEEYHWRFRVVNVHKSRISKYVSRSDFLDWQNADEFLKRRVIEPSESHDLDDPEKDDDINQQERRYNLRPRNSKSK